MELLAPACFLELSEGERLQQLYLAYEGTEECFVGRSRIEQLRLLAEQIGIEGCIFNEVDLYRGWLVLLNPEACAEPSRQSLQGAVYALLYAEAGDDTLVDPACFYGLSPELREQAMFEVAEVVGGGVTPVELGVLNMISSGLLLEEPWNNLDAWENSGNWYPVAQKGLICYGKAPRTLITPGVNDPDGVREGLILAISDDLWYAVSDGGNGVDPWRQWMRSSTNRGLTWTELGEFAGGIGAGNVATFTGWFEQRGATCVALVGTTDTLFPPPNTGLPSPPYGFEVRTSSSATSGYSVVGTVDPVPATWSASEILPGGTLRVGATYCHFAQGKLGGSNIGILTSADPAGISWAQLSADAIADEATVGLLGRVPENPKPFHHPLLEQYGVLVNLINGSKTDCNGVLLSDLVDDWDEMTVSLGMFVSPGFGVDAIGVQTHVTAPDGVLAIDAETGFLPVIYDAGGTPAPGYHLQRNIFVGVYEPYRGLSRFTSINAEVEKFTRPLANTDLIWELPVRFKNTTADTSVAFEYRRDGAGVLSDTYRMVLRNGLPITLQKRISGGYTTIENSADAQVGQNGFWQIFSGEITGTTHKAFLNGEEQINSVDAAIASGTHIALSGFGIASGGDMEIGKLVIYTSKSVTVSGLPASDDIVVRCAGLPIQVVTADGSGNASITLDHWPVPKIQIGDRDFGVKRPIYGGSVLEFDSAGIPSSNTPPTLTSATIAANGTTLTLVFSKAAEAGTQDNQDLSFTATNGTLSAKYVSGSGTATLVYSLIRTVYQTETVTLNYDALWSGIKDLAGNNLASIMARLVTNNSTVSAFTIAGLPDIELWLKADEITGLADTNPVVTYPDSSGHGRNVGQSSAGLQPVYRTAIQNDLPVVRFAADYLRNAGFAALNAKTGASVATVLAFTAGTGTNYIAHSPDNFALLVQCGSGSVNVYVSSGNYGSFALADTGFHVLTAVFDGSLTGDSNRLKVYLDGAQQTLAFTGAIPAVTTSATGYEYGALTSSGTQAFAGDIGETLTCAQAWDATTLGNIETLLKAKWGTP